MSSRDSGNGHHLSIDTAHANAVHSRHANQQALPSPMSSTSRSSSNSLSSQLPCPPPEGMISTATLSHPPTLAIPSVPYFPPTHLNNAYHYQQQQQHQQPPQPRQRSLSGSGSRGGSIAPSWSNAASPVTGSEEEEQLQRMAMTNVNRRPSLPVNHPYHHPMERLPSHDPRRQQQILQQHQQQQQYQSQQSYFRQQHGGNMGGRSSSSSQQQGGGGGGGAGAGAAPLTPNTPTSSSSGPAPPLTSSNSNSNNSSSSSNNSNGAGAPPPQVVRHPLWRLDCQSCKTTLCEQAMQGHLVGDPSKKLFSTNLAIGVLGLPDRPVSIICPCKFHLFACASCGSVCGYNLSQPCAGCETNRGNGHFWIFYAHEITAHWRTTEEGRQMFWDDLPTWCHTSDGNVGR